ncbi:MAG: TIGR01777 family oxidoreductase [Verrucomicrobiota bacterium]|nr:TIGR01777 family oxidoreductase [Verrucomicrobiota bacterium]
MTIGITGATGFIGCTLVDLVLRRGHEVVAFTRQPSRTIPGCEMRAFSLEHPPDLTGCHAVIHLAGEPAAGLWTPAKKRRILESRQLGTRRVVEAIAAAKDPPEVLVSGSAIGFYSDAGDSELTEQSAAGVGFLAETVQAWEAEARRAAGCRVVLVRTGLVLGKGGGAMRALAPIFRLGLGGPIGNGRQWMSWIHVADEARLLLFAAENLEVRGPLNATAPWPVRNAEFAATLARVLDRPGFLRVPAFALRMLGEFSRELLDSKRVLPEVATEHQFGFHFPELEPALKNFRLQ